MKNDVPTAPFPLHDRLLVAATATSLPSRVTADLFERVDAATSWDKAIEMAYRHAVVPQLYKASKAHSERIPEQHLLFLRQAYKQIARENMRLGAELINLAAAFDERGFEYLSIKGPILTEEIYGDITMRQMCDLDIFVDEADVTEVAHLLKTLGYETKLPLTLLHNSGFRALDNDFTFLHPDKKVMLELHWKLFPARHQMTLGFATLYRNKKVVTLHKQPVSTLSTEHNLLYLCLHGAKHIFEELKWVSDIDRLLRFFQNADLEKTYNYAEELEVTEPFLLGLLVSRNLYDTPLPNFILERVTPLTEELLQLTLHYFSDDFNTLDEPVKKRIRFLFLNRLNQHKQIGALAMIQSVFKPSSVDYIHYNLPSRFNFLYPLLRPPRLLYKYLIKKLFA